MYLLGYDIGSSSVKASIIKVSSGDCIASAFFPKTEMPITAVKPGWAEQDPENWWKYLKQATYAVLDEAAIDPNTISGIGISYQMHGLVLVDKNQKVLRPSIIWCDSRAVEIGERAFTDLGQENCLSHLLNSPGNFTASKLKWVKENEPEIYRQIYKIMLPGDYIAMKMTGEICTTVSGLSEGIMWDFKSDSVASLLLEYYGFSPDFIPNIVPTFSEQGRLSIEAAAHLGLTKGIPVAYRAGDQPNNAFSLNVLNPGEIAATAGTSGVVYGISGAIQYDPKSRVNTFAHVNHSQESARLGVLLCINGTGILNSWTRKITGLANESYDALNRAAGEINIGSNRLAILPFGNGAERVLGNKNIGCHLAHVDFNQHTNKHILRAAQEGIVFAFQYGIEIMKQTGINPTVIRAGKANMFLSPVFRNTLAGLTGARIELYNTDGSQGAARGAGMGARVYKNFNEAFNGLKRIETIEPDIQNQQAYKEAYEFWLENLKRVLC